MNSRLFTMVAAAEAMAGDSPTPRRDVAGGRRGVHEMIAIESHLRGRRRS